MFQFSLRSFLDFYGKKTFAVTVEVHRLVFSSMLKVANFRGYRVEYCAASDALTYAPEGFNEFFNQRRRWIPSTIANIYDLLKDYKNVVSVNENISIW